MQLAEHADVLEACFRPEDRADFRRRMLCHRDLLLHLLGLVPDFIDQLRPLRPIRRYEAYIVGEMAAFIVGRIDFFRSIDVLVLTSESTRHARKLFTGPLNRGRARARFAISRSVFSNVQDTTIDVPITIHVNSLQSRRLLPLQSLVAVSLHGCSPRIHVDECACWSSDGELTRIFDEHRDRLGEHHRNSSVATLEQALMRTMLIEQRYMTLGAERRCTSWAPLTRSLLTNIEYEARAQRQIFVNLESRHFAAGAESPSVRALRLHLGEREYEACDISGSRALLRYREPPRRGINFLATYCQICRLRDRLLTAYCRFWRFEACESLDSRALGGGQQQNSDTEPHASEGAVADDVSAIMNQVLVVMQPYQHVRRALLHWILRTARARWRDVARTHFASVRNTLDIEFQQLQPRKRTAYWRHRRRREMDQVRQQQQQQQQLRESRSRRTSVKLRKVHFTR